MNIFQTVVQHTPLIAIDFIVEDQKNRILLGKRLNPPAQNFIFVPGGRIQKNEPIAEAFKRLTRQEFGAEFSIEQAKLLGIFDHFYGDSIFGNYISTHYVAIGYKIKITKLTSLTDQQHSDYHWLDIDAILSNEDAHQNTKKYFL